MGSQPTDKKISTLVQRRDAPKGSGSTDPGLAYGAPRRNRGAKVSRRTLLRGFGGLVAAGGLLPVLAACASKSAASSPSPESVFIYRGHGTSPIASVEWSPDGTRLASAASTMLQVWEASSGKTLMTYHDQNGSEALVLDAVWSPQGTLVALGDLNNAAQLIGATTGHVQLTYRGHREEVNSVTWSPDGSRVASGSGDTTVQIWESITAKTLVTYRGHQNYVEPVVWSPDGAFIASGDWENLVQVWEAGTGTPILTYTGHARRASGILKTLAWSPDARRIASGSADQTVQVWDATSGEHALVYTGHTSGVWGVAWSPDGKRIASAGAFPDATVQVWDARDGTHQYTYRGHARDHAVTSVAWSPDGKRIASGSDDGTVHVWQPG